MSYYIVRYEIEPEHIHNGILTIIKTGYDVYDDNIDGNVYEITWNKGEDDIKGTWIRALHNGDRHDVESLSVYEICCDYSQVKCRK